MVGMLASLQRTDTKSAHKKLDGDNSGPQGFEVAVGQQLSLNHNAIRITDPQAKNAQHLAFFKSFTKD